MFELTYKNLQINIKENYSESYKGDNICILKGPNDTGKTTALALIKLAFSNFQLNQIDNETMKNKLKLILNNPDFEMHLLISSYDNSFSIRIDYDNNLNRADYYINNRPTGYTHFIEDIELLYEVPGEAIKKFQGILYDTKNKLTEYEKILIAYEAHINELYDKLTRYEHSEKRKNQITSKIQQLNEKLESIKFIYDQDLKKYQELHNKFIYNKYRELEIDISMIESKIDELNRNIKKDKYKNRKINRYGNEVLNKAMEIYQLINSDKSLFDSLVYKDEKYRNIFEDKLKLLNSNNIDDINLELISSFNTYFNQIKQQNSEKLNNSDDNESVLQYRLVEQLIDLINKYIDKNPIIPIFENTAAEFLKKLYNEEEKLKVAYNQYEKIENLNSACDNIIKELGNLTLLLKTYDMNKDKNKTKNIMNIKDDQYSDIIDYESLIKKMESEKERLIKERSSIEDEYRHLPEAYNKYNLEILGKILEDAKNKYEDDKRKIDSLEKDINDQKILLDNLEIVEKPSCDMTKNEMELESNLLVQIKKKLKNYKELIDLLLSNNSEQFPRNTSSDKFFEILGKYIANIIKFIYHLHEKYRLLGIDFVNRAYLIEPTESGTDRISFDSIGTGTSALNGLLARMHQDTNGKKLIILVDEIGDMDDNNLKNLINNAEIEIKANRLLLMLMTRPDNKSNDTKSKAVCESIKFDLGDKNYGIE
ncbi:hypothetical protein DMB44_09030 [Thermoplasma sp. Kam2015]|uniref:hypothetical protein n=1 Tax=Thermoplasma sp. Kam2015 TaxID=2094122 RepID=UPI000D95D897|nr:hypothetical protein [Thermoplasma sp. Kam2015]PYB67465.1 hypothetical protein DMB44_09030 [Thermoplasma sp. Kam2015]